MYINKEPLCNKKFQLYLDSIEATRPQPHVTEGQSDGEGITKLNHKVNDSLRKRLPQSNQDDATKTAPTKKA